jgi:hypothetical protein
MDVYKVPLTITSSFASTRTRWTHGPKALSTRGDGGAKNYCDKVMCVGALLCALLPREFFSARGAACNSARCRVRCYCCAR